MRPSIVVAGLGETGSDLVARLRVNWEVIGIDVDEAAVRALEPQERETEQLRLYVGDACSGLVLQRARIDDAHAVVACAGSDEVNLEICRLARSRFDVKNALALAYTLDGLERYKAEGISVVSQDRACAALLESRVERGQRVATGIGLGQGEIVEVEVLPSSSVAGKSLKELRPRRWLVGAIYRDSELIVPHGSTVIETGDHVVVIGEPEVLPHIASLIRSGGSEFPLRFGSRLVAVGGRGAESLADEAAYLIEFTRATRFEALAPDAVDSLASLVAAAEGRDLGVLLLEHEPLPFLSRIGLGRSRTARVMDRVHAPVLVCRRSFPYRRVLLVLAELPFPMDAAEVAIDLVRKLDAELHVAAVQQPELVVGAEAHEEMAGVAGDIEALASMYHVEVRTHRLVGNPIQVIENVAGDYDLLVVPHARGRKTFLTSPSVSLNLIHRVPCSVMALPYDD
jgi:uncharacterized protein